MKSPKTLQDAILYFADFEHCRQFLMDLRWPDGKVTCPTCGFERVTYLVSVRRWKCYEKHPRPQFSLKTGTIFEDSPLGLDKWLAALWLIVNCKNGISSMKISRDLGITQKSAWFMAHRLRFALHHGSFDKLSGEVEVDETFIGGKARNMHIAQRKRRITGTGGKDKTAVMGILERGGTVRMHVVGEAGHRHAGIVSMGELRRNASAKGAGNGMAASSLTWRPFSFSDEVVAEAHSSAQRARSSRRGGIAQTLPDPLPVLSDVPS